MKTIRVLLIVLCLVLFGAPAHYVGADLQRGLQNYVDLMNGKKKLEQLSPEELQEVLIIHQRLKGQGRSSSRGGSRPSYEIEVAHNDELFIINGEKYEAKTYCLGWKEGNSVVSIARIAGRYKLR